ncbi:MAG: hypothetical protein IJ564_03365 [Alphaproteobacteria bacterium]|nr:hypothetical protein [Alphaproteobacteria bacterium]
MTNELRKTLGRNMRFAKMNENIDNQIRQLQAQSSYDVNTQAQINALERQKYLNKQQMQQPMSEIEYEQYDDNGQYIGGQGVQQKMQTEQANGLGQKTLDAVNHAAQGIGLGWSDELNGVIGGVGNVLANGVMRAFGQDVNGESFGDAWKRGYTEYRDFARQELNDGYERNPIVSGLAEVGGALVSPIKPFSGMTGAVANGVIGGVGMTDTNSPAEYAINIGLNTAGSIAGEKFGNILENKTNNLLKERAKNLSFGLSKSARAFTKMGANSVTNQISSWRKDDEW